MIITLITPSFGEKLGYAHMEPLTMAVLASLVPKGYEVRFYDDRIEDIPFDNNTDLVAISVETFTARRAYQIADAFRQRKRKVVLGGFHVTLMPDEALAHADTIVIGQAERTWPQVIRDARADVLKPRYQDTERNELEGIIPDRSIFKGKRYVPLGLVEFGRGCKFACDFCSVHTFFGSKRITRPVDDVIRDIIATKRRYILLIDDNVVSDRQKAKELFEKMIPLKVLWIGQASIDILDDDELLDLIARSGCFGLLFGGHHPTLIPDEAIQHADAVVLGEADTVWRELLEDAKTGRLKKQYRAQARPLLHGMVARDRELLDLMQKSGCVGVLIGFESLEHSNLDLMNKQWNEHVLSYPEALRIIGDYGIGIYATFVFGYDHDTQDSIKRTVEFAIKQKFLLAAFNHLVPFPGTPLYDRLKAENRLLYDKWWLHPTYQYGDIAFKHPHFSPEQLSALCLQARRDFFSLSSIGKRFLDAKVNCRSPYMAMLYLWSNMLLRSEVSKKRALVVGK